jgi:hypothetical protein
MIVEVQDLPPRRTSSHAVASYVRAVLPRWPEPASPSLYTPTHRPSLAARLIARHVDEISNEAAA